MQTAERHRHQGPARSAGGQLIYAIGDIHGRFDLLAKMISAIRCDVATTAPAAMPVLLPLGDYIDRGPASRQTIDCLIETSESGEFEMRCLLGNHEEAMLDFLDRKTQGSGWVRHGGGPTMLSYGVPVPSPDASRERWSEARRALSAAVPPAHERFLRKLELHVSYGDYLFVHAGVRPDVPLEQQSARDLLWIRRGFLEWEGDGVRTVVHGHTPTEKVRILSSRIGLDSGAYLSGTLSGVRIDDDGPTLISVSASVGSPVISGRAARL